MSWDVNRSRSRILQFTQSVPRGNVSVTTFDQGFLQNRQRVAQGFGKRLFLDEAPIINIPVNQAILVDGVHVYVQLLGYHDALQDQGRETEASHRRVFQFLHLHYSAADRIVAAFEGQRVDFHGPRLHAVVVTPPGAGNERARVIRAIAMASTLQATIEEAGAKFGNQQLKARVRIGIDTGMAVAVNSGRGSEPEPLFLGSPANYAAKLAEGTEPGIFLSDRARAVLGMRAAGSLLQERAMAMPESQALGYVHQNAGGQYWQTGSQVSRQKVDEAIRSLQADTTLKAILGTEAVFRFHHHEPPLRSISFADLMPSNSIRMPLMSVFADIDGFTAYVDRCIATGQVAEMVMNLHVIRGELAAVLKDDFKGRKVRFIGDCLHGLIAEGSRVDTDKTSSVTSAVLLSGGLRSSFDLCRRLLPGIGDLGLAIGVELGTTPVTRLGIRGDRSVRCASSKAVSASEDLQRKCNGVETALGEAAFASANARVKGLFRTGIARNLDFETADIMLSGVTAPAVVAAVPRSEFRAHGNR
jgi:class 3 adenylate cyclase